MSEEDFAALLAEYDSPSRKKVRLEIGQTVSGTVISVGAEAVFVDLGGKSEGMLETIQVSDSEGNVLVKVGDTIEAKVVDDGEQSGTILLRRGVSKGPDVSLELQQAYESGMTVEGTVTELNKGGFDVTIAGVRAFCPISQIDASFVEDGQAFVGQKLSFRITRFEKGGARGPNIVVSRRVLLEEENAARAAETRGTLEAGKIVNGTVSSLKPYGAFVDLGGIEGMLHISELGHTRVDDPADVLRVGQELRVQILRIEKTDNPKRPEKISLSLKALEQDPWSDISERFPAGAEVQGTVARLQPFGAFVELTPGIEGLVHISEMGGGRRLAHPREVLTVGQAVSVTVLRADAGERRISLSLDAANREAAARDEKEAIAEHKNKGSQSLGTFADLLKR